MKKLNFMTDNRTKYNRLKEEYDRISKMYFNGAHYYESRVKELNAELEKLANIIEINRFELEVII